MATILLIDDDIDLVEMNAVVLAHRGHKVIHAYSAAQARQVLAEGAKPDLVVLDVMMEDPAAGYDLAREISRRQPPVPTVILSGIRGAMGVPPQLEPEAQQLPVAKFMDKPVAPAALADEIEAILAGSTGPAAP